MKRIVLSTAVLCLAILSQGKDTTRPWTFWYWMYGAVSEAGIRADLQAMKDVGLGGCYLMPIRGTGESRTSLPPLGAPAAQQLTPQFWRMVDCALQQADSLGLEMGIHVCDGFALAGGPWITPAESMQKIVFCDTLLTGGHHRFTMPKPRHYEDYYEDIAAYAIPVNSPQAANAPQHSHPLTYSPEVTVNAKGVYCADKPCWLQYAFDKPTTVRSIEVEPSGTNIQSQRLLVTASDDGVIFYKVKQLTPPRQGWQNTGFNTTFSIPPTTARYFRFEWTPEGTEPGAEDLDAAKWKPVLRLKAIRLSGYALLDNWEGKAGYVWRIAPDTPETDVAMGDFIRADQVVRCPVQGDVIDLQLPAGQWRLLRMGHTSTGHTNATAGGAKGLECDKFSRQAVEKQIDAWFGLFMQRPHHGVVKYMHVDSWECGSQNWSRNFAQEFQKRRGYDLLPLLPIYAGVPMTGGDETLRDIRLTINELVNEVFFATVASKARQYGVLLSSESVAPTMVSDGIEHYRYADVPMGEFWLHSPTHDKPNDMFDAISGGHVYGKQIIQAEGFTELRGVWNETPAMVKPLLDRNFALGINRLFFHVNTHNPWLDRRPGMTLDGIGLFFQRDQTWFPEARAFVDYITRCQRLLQEGQPVVDIAVYTGEEMPSRSLTPDRLVNMLPGLFGPERVAREQARRANHGLRIVESPVGVRHSDGIIDLQDWVNPLHGYHYDSMNKDALLNRPFHYRALIVPQGLRLSAEARNRFFQLRQNGVLVLERPFDGDTLPRIAPDAVLPDGIAFCHRATADRDIYFLANQKPVERRCSASFRITEGTPVVYHPVTDETTAADFSRQNGRTVVSLSLPAYGSCFVVFSKKSTAGTEAYRPSPRTPQELGAHRWDITFGETHLTLGNQALFDWSQHADPRIRYYSGHARYTATFKYRQPAAPRRVALSLPDVRNIAHVWLNGHDCGIAWTAPYEVDVTRALKKGRNTLEIEVVNTWHNALRGADQGKAPFDGIWTNAAYRTEGDALLPAGLLKEPILLIEE